LASLAEHLRYLEAEFEAARAAPLSTRKALLVAMLADAYADRLFAAQSVESDVLVFRRGLTETSIALGIIFSLTAQRPDGPRLVLEPVAIPIPPFGSLSVEDFMVSLYNDHTVQQVLIVMPDGERWDAHEVLRAGIKALKTTEPE
jgi:hypothetical protein